MKKILALVLAVAMLSTTAFAATVTVTGKNAAQGTSIDATPGSTIRIEASAFAKGTAAVDALDTTKTGWRLCSEFFTISSKKFDKGANLVKEVKINEDKNTVDIVLKEDYALLAPKGANLVIGKLALKAKDGYEQTKGTPAQGDITKNSTYVYGDNANGTDVPKEVYVGFPTTDAGVVRVTEVAGDKYEQDLAKAPVYVNGVIVKFTNPGKTNPYETASLSASDVTVEGRVYADDKCYVGVDNDVNTEVLKLDDAASMRFYNITTNGLPTANTLKITAEETEFVYKIVDNKIVASGLKWSADDAAFVGKIRSSANYVISDIELKAAPAAEGDKPATTNPDTGANDVVGIAAALAVVSLVAAGAVSMKK